MNDSRTKNLSAGKERCPLCEYEKRQCVRCQAYERLPKWKALQSLITFVMGAPHPGERPLLTQTRKIKLATIFSVFFGSIILTVAITSLLSTVGLMAKLILIPPLVAAMMTSSGMFRSMSMYVLHYASHGAYGRYSRVIGHVASALALSLSLDEYSVKHIRKHHPRLTSAEDPDQQTIIALGFIPGMALAYYGKRLLMVMLSPGTFLLHLRGRLSSQFAAEQARCIKAITVALHTAPPVMALYVGYAYNFWTPLLAWLVAWLLPLTYGTYVSMILFSLGLHRWFLEREPWMSPRDFYLAKTGGRFFGDPSPSTNLPLAKRYLAWSRWWARFILLHLMVGKLFIMGLSDNQQHDTHHIDPQSREFYWWDSIQSRHRLATSGADAGKLWHTWGSPCTAIRLNFNRMARTPALKSEEIRPAKGDNDLLNGM